MGENPAAPGAPANAVAASGLPGPLHPPSPAAPDGPPAPTGEELAAVLPEEEVRRLARDWGWRAHAGQRAPAGDWTTWLVLGGRGGGKTRAGAEWVADRAAEAGRIALVGQSLHDVREVMIEGPSGLRALPRYIGGGRPVWEASRRRLIWPNGAVGLVFSAEDPEALRGPQFGTAWADEWCAWRRPGETLALLRMGLRLGARPRLVVTTTPRPLGALRRLLKEPGVVRTDLPTRVNADHLAPAFLEGLEAVYGGTRLAAQELDGRLVDGDGALFTHAMIAAARAAGRAAAPRCDRVVVAVDPPCSEGGDACGIVVVGRAGGVAHVLADRSAAGLSPQAWGARAARAAIEFGARRIVAEANQGGRMVEAVLKAAGAPCPVRLVHARYGKRARAEPVAALYEQGRVAHRGDFPELEEELLGLGCEGGDSPDRADALVWAVTDLLVDGAARGGPRMRFV